ncbi:MAG TPA: SRPBCC family protein [Terriglobia bacterium]|nr:SRPBCC family protein [Terriglobia bacterium]
MSSARTLESMEAVENRQRSTAPPGSSASGIARGLGWFSVGLGIAELVAPRAIGRIAGARKKDSLIRSYGVREIVAGVGVLATSHSAGWLWARVAGDAVDLASLGAARAARRNAGKKNMLALGSVAGVTALDVWCASRLSRAGAERSRAHAEGSLMVSRSPEECYRFWRNFENLPRFVNHLKSVQSTGDRSSRWTAYGPGGVEVEWDTEIEEDVPNKQIAWRARDGSHIWHSGVVNFENAPGGRGTIVRVQMDYGNTLKVIGLLATPLGKNPNQLIRKQLRRFKQVLETGESITTEGQPAGRRSGATWLDEIAR